MKSVRSRLTVTFIGLIAVILAVIWGVNKWYLEDFYVTKKVQALNAMYYNQCDAYICASSC